MISPTYFVVNQARIEAAIEEARRASDIGAMQAGLRELTNVLAAYYGRPSEPRKDGGGTM